MMKTRTFKSIPMTVKELKPIEPHKAIWISAEKKWRFFTKDNQVIPRLCVPKDIDQSPPESEVWRI